MRHALPFVSAALLYASFQPLDFGFLAWVALVPVAVWAARERGGWRVFLIAWLAGTLSWTALLSWTHYTAPWIGPPGLGLYKGFYFALFAWVVRLASAPGAKPRVPLAIAVPVAWLAIEFARGHVLGGLPIFLLGYAAHRLEAVIQIADVGGVWLVSALVALVNGALASAFLEGARARRRGAVVAAAAVVLSAAYGAVRLATIPLEDGMRVGIVQPNIPQDVKEIGKQDDRDVQDMIYAKHMRLTLELAREQPDLIVWPEVAMLDPVYCVGGRWDRDGVFERARAPAVRTGIPCVTGVIVLDTPAGAAGDPERSSVTNTALYFGADGSVLGRFDKIGLVQFSEYAPMGDVLPVARIVAWFLRVRRLHEFKRGREYPVFEHAKGKFATSICSENYYPEISREFARNGARTLVNISNDGWFRESAELDAQTVMARFRAIENRVLYIRATNTGISAVIDPLGRITAMIEGPDGRRKSVEGTLAASGRVTSAGSPWRTLGDWIVWLACGLAAGGVAALVPARRRAGNVDAGSAAE